MIRFSNTVDIARPDFEVFAYLADLEHTPEWNWAITSTRKFAPGPVAAGTRHRQTRSVPRAGSPRSAVHVADGRFPFPNRSVVKLCRPDRLGDGPVGGGFLKFRPETPRGASASPAGGAGRRRVGQQVGHLGGGRRRRELVALANIG